MRRLLLLAIASLPVVAAAEEPSDVELTVKPLLCIIDKRVTTCEALFRVSWTSAESGYYCVSNDIETAALKCWSNDRRGELDDERAIDADLTYSIDQGDGKTLDAVTVEVVRIDSDDRRRRRRTRHVWDLL